MEEQGRDSRASAEIVVVKPSLIGRPAALVMTIKFTKEAGVSFSDGGRLVYWIIRSIENGIHEVDPNLVTEWVGEGFKIGGERRTE